MRRRRLSLIGALLLGLLLAAPAAALTIQGRVLDPRDRPVAGALLSDGVGIIASDAQGRFRLDSAPGRVVALTAPAGMKVIGSWWWPAPVAARQAEFRLAPARPLPQRPRLAILSDAHLFDASSPPHGKYSPQVDPALPLRAWRSAARGVASFQPHLTLFAGDLCMDADKGDLAHGRAQFALAARAWARLPAPRRAVPGNHDVRYGGGRAGRALWREFMGPARHIYFWGPLAVVLLDNPGLGRLPDGGPRQCGRLPAEALAWLRSALRLIPRRTPLLLVSHYPLASPLAGANPLYPGAVVAAPPPAGLALRDVDQSAALVLALLGARPLVGLISGHQHALYQALIQAQPRPLHLLGAPALSGRWWQGDMVYGPLRFAPGYLRAWLSRDAGGWRLTAQMVRGDWARRSSGD